MRLRTLGGLELEGSRFTGPKPLLLLVYLSLEGPKPRHFLAELFWPEARDPRNMLASALKQLKRDAPGVVDADRMRVWTELDSDASQFLRATKEGAYEEALELYKNSFLEGTSMRWSVELEEWVYKTRENLAKKARQALLRQSEALERSQKYQEALNIVEEVVKRDSLDETAYQVAMRLESGRGNSEAALMWFERCRETLQRELEAEPSQETLVLLQTIERGGAPGSQRATLANVIDEVPARPQTLIGREELLAELETLLGEGQSVLLHGFGGMGKTALAATVAVRYLAENKKPVLWLQAGNEASDTLFDALAHPFGERQRIAEETGTAKVKAIQKMLAAQAIGLLVLDDAWNGYALSKVREAIPEGVSLLVTSRQRYPKLRRLDVGKLARPASLTLLSFSAQKELREDPQADTLCDTLGDHAFALRLAGIKLSVDLLSPSQLLSQLGGTPHRLAVPPELAEKGRESISALLSVSVESLSDEAYEVFLGFGALFAPRSTPELLARCIRRDPNDVEEALFDLQKRALTERLSEPGSDAVVYRLHDLAYSFVAVNSNLRPRTVVRALRDYLQEHQHDFATLDAEIVNLIGAAQHAQSVEDDEALVEMMERLVVGDAYFTARGHTPRSLALLEVAAEAAVKEELLRTAQHLATKLGNSYRELLGDTDRALSAYQKALDLARKEGDRHQEVVLLSLLGIVHFERGDKVADSNLEEAHRLAKNYGDDLGLSHVLQHRGFVAGHRENWQETKTFSEEAVEAALRLQGDSTISKLEVDYHLFFALLNLGEAERMLQNLDQSLDLRRRALGMAEAHNNEIWMAYARREMGEVFHAMNERYLAEEEFVKALVLLQKNNVAPDVQELLLLMSEKGYSQSELAR